MLISFMICPVGSSMHRLNNSGTRIEPWGTPHVTMNTATTYPLPLRHDQNRKSVPSSLSRSSLCSVLVSSITKTDVLPKLELRQMSYYTFISAVSALMRTETRLTRIIELKHKSFLNIFSSKGKIRDGSVIIYY